MEVVMQHKWKWCVLVDVMRLLLCNASVGLWAKMFSVQILDEVFVTMRVEYEISAALLCDEMFRLKGK